MKPGPVTMMTALIADIIMSWDNLMKRVDSGEIKHEEAVSIFDENIKAITPGMKDAAHAVLLANQLGVKL